MAKYSLKFRRITIELRNKSVSINHKTYFPIWNTLKIYLIYILKILQGLIPFLSNISILSPLRDSMVKWWLF